MAIEFHVTEVGLPLADGRMAMPGSVVKLNKQPPAHWSRFGEVRNVQERKLEVATPEPNKTVEAPSPVFAADPELDELRALYLQETGEEADGRWKSGRIRKELGLDG